MNARRGSLSRLTAAELGALLSSRWTVLLFLAYAGFSCAVYFSEAFRQTWIQIIDSNIFTSITNLYMPIFLIAAILVIISPIFAGDKKIGMEELGDTCFYGKRSRRICKVEAALLYTLIICAGGFLVTLLVSMASKNPLKLEQKAFEMATLDLTMTNAQFYLFSFGMELVGLFLLTALTLFASSRSDDPIAPMATTLLVCGIELALYLIPVILVLWEFNLFRLFRPYTLLTPSLIFGSTLQAILAVVAFFMLLALLLLWATLAAGTKKTRKVWFIRRKLLAIY